MTDERAKRISDLGTKLFTERKNVMTMRQEIAENFYPERADFFEDNIFNADFAAHLMDSSPVLTCQELANAIPAMTRPKSKKWFKQSTGDDELDERTDVSQFLERNSDIQRRQMYRRQSMLTRALRQKDRDWVTFGESVMSVEETKDRENLIYKTHHTRDIAFMDDENGITNHLHRKMKMTARNIVSKFGKDAEIHDSVRTAADN